MTKNIHIKLSETEANTLLKVVETHPDRRVWGTLSRNDVTSEIRRALSAGVRGDDIDWEAEAEGLKGALSDDYGDSDSSGSVDDRIANMTFNNSNQVRQDQDLDPIVQTPAEDETSEGDEAADGQIEDEAGADVETDESGKSEDELLAEMIAEEEANEDSESDGEESDEVAEDGDVDNSNR